MPELPEVETVCRGLAAAMAGRYIAEVAVRRRDLRWPIAADFEQRLAGARVMSVRRRAKYGLIDTDRSDVMILHLGMSGRMRLNPPDALPHDHVAFALDDGARILFNDPRRFGSLHLARAEDWMSHPLLAGLGPEPLANEFNGPALHHALGGRRAPVKAAILDQRVVAGIGNIYASEALFRARIHPARPACELDAREAERLATAIKAVLADAIAAGGSSLRDYAQVDGELGYFQHSWAVYGREEAPCPRCCGPIARMVQSNRSTFLCPACQA